MINELRPRRPRRAPLACGCAAVVLASCGADPAGPGGDACGPPPQTHALSRAFAEHACLHAVHGPFEAVEPPPDGGPPVELRNAHVAYTVPLGPNAPGAAGPGVFYEPKVNAPFAFFLGERRPLSLVDEGGRRVCPVAVHDATACAELARAVFFDLQRKRPYRLEVGPGEAPAVVVVIEEVF